MDWLETWVEKGKQYIRNASLAKAATAYFFLAVAGCMACILFTRNLSEVWLKVMEQRDKPPEQWIFFVACIYYGCPYIYAAAAFFLAIRGYLKYKIAPPLKQMQTALNCMLAGDLGYEIAYRSSDELGMLCKKAEELRNSLRKEKERQWQAGEEQRKINAAFAHDIRTPLTIIKGYTEFLQKYVPQGKVSRESLLEKLEAIGYQEERLFAFSKTMTKLQQMEKWEVNCRRSDLEEIFDKLKETATGMETEEVGIYTYRAWQENVPVLVDLELILEAVENVLGNGLRYAKNRIELSMQYTENRLDIYIKDDGEGFTPRALREASMVYFSEEKDREEGQEHFGIGLSITKLLCEKHGGNCTVINGIEGGGIVTLSFYVGE